MKVVRKRKKGVGSASEPWVGKKVECRSCHAAVVLEQGDKVQSILDFRDGDYYMFKCPECKCTVTLAASLCT